MIVNDAAVAAAEAATALAQTPLPFRNRIVGFDEVYPDQLLANPENWRIHPLSQQQAMQGNLESIGWVQTVIENVQTGHMLDGHLRAKLAEDANEHLPQEQWVKVPRLLVDLSPEEELVVIATFDPLSAMAVRDSAKHAELLSRVRSPDSRLQALMDDLRARAQEQAERESRPTEEPELGAKGEGAGLTQTRVQPGDLWALGRHRLLCADTHEPDSLDRLIQQSGTPTAPTLLWCDPPYGMRLDADYAGMGGKGHLMDHSNTYDNIEGDHEDYDPAPLRLFIAQHAPDLREGFWWGADYYAERLPDKNEGSWVVWDKRGNEDMDRGFGSTFELCWSQTRHKRLIARVLWTGLFGLSSEPDKHKRRLHATQKPVALTAWFLDRFGQSGDVVLDPYAGAGGCLLACERLGNLWLGLEMLPQNCDVILARWEEMSGQTATRLEGTESEDEQ